MKRQYRVMFACAFLLLLSAGITGSIGVWQPPHSAERNQWTNQAMILGIAGLIVGMAAVVGGDMDGGDE